MTSPDRIKRNSNSPDISPKARGRLINLALVGVLVGTITIVCSEVHSRVTKPQICGDVKAHTLETNINSVTTSRVEARGGAGFESIIDYLLKTGQLAGTGIKSVGQFALAVRAIRFYDDPTSTQPVLTRTYSAESPFNLYRAGGINDQLWVEFEIDPEPLQP